MAEPQLSPQDASTVTILARRAMAGDEDALSLLLERFTPHLLALCRHLMSSRLRLAVDPEDVVQDVWGIALPLIPSMESKDGHLSTPVLKFLSTILRNRLGTLFQKHVRNKPEKAVAASESSPDPVQEISASTSNALRHVIRRETQDTVHRALALLPREDRKIILFRGIQQAEYSDLSRELGLSEAALRMRYSRALRRLREVLSRSLIDDLSAE